MTAEQMRAILDWRMCSDPWPGGDMNAVDDWLDGVCREGGYQDWVDAYHSLNKCKWCGHDIHAHDKQYGCAEDGCDCETPNAAVQPRAEGTSRCNSLLGGNAKEKT